MNITHDVTSCSALKCVVGCLTFGFEDNFIDGECLMIGTKKFDKIYDVNRNKTE